MPTGNQFEMSSPASGGLPIELNSRHTFALAHAQDEHWSIIDDADCRVFTGSLAECEEWLDREERRALNALPKPSFLRLATAWLQNMSSRSAVKESQS